MTSAYGPLAPRRGQPSRRPRPTIGLLLGVATVLLIGSEVHAVRSAAAPSQEAGPAAVQDRLSDRDFWALVGELSEPGGTFHSDNFTSNEANVGDLLADLAGRLPHGGAYLGVGPEQNFSYILALRPQLAFIVDIRRQNVVEHLLYKAVFELAPDRVSFLSLLFSQPRPARLPVAADLAAIWAALARGRDTDSERLRRNVTAVESELIDAHGFALSAEDRASLESVYEAFFRFGPSINYGSGGRSLSTGSTNFEKLSTIADRHGTLRGFLATEAGYQYVRDLETRNLIVPIEGDFGGPHTLRDIGAYLKARRLPVRAFYVSNVEQYLFQPYFAFGTEANGGWRAFYANVQTLPLDGDSLFIRPPFGSPMVAVRTVNPDGAVHMVQTPVRPLCPMLDFLKAVDEGRITTPQAAMVCG
jgi:hypothetical protein